IVRIGRREAVCAGAGNASGEQWVVSLVERGRDAFEDVVGIVDDSAFVAAEDEELVLDDGAAGVQAVLARVIGLAVAVVGGEQAVRIERRVFTEAVEAVARAVAGEAAGGGGTSDRVAAETQRTSRSSVVIEG